MFSWRRSLLWSMVIAIISAGAIIIATQVRHTREAAASRSDQVGIVKHLVANYAGIHSVQFVEYHFDTGGGGTTTSYTFRVNHQAREYAYDVQGVPGSQDFSNDEDGVRDLSGKINLSEQLSWVEGGFFETHKPRQPRHNWRRQSLQGVSVTYTEVMK